MKTIPESRNWIAPVVSRIPTEKVTPFQARQMFDDTVCPVSNENEQVIKPDSHL